MLLFAAKLIGTPCLVIFVSLMARRFGPEGAGILAGLPLASGPVAALLVAAHGASFGRSAAAGILLGLFGAQAFIAVYGKVSARAAWPVTLTAALGAYLFVAAASYVVAPGPLLVIAVVLVGLVVLQRLLGPVVEGPDPHPVTDHGWPDIVLRAALSTAVVVGLTALAPFLGARLSGILAPIPVVTGILSVFTQRSSGAAAVMNLLRGVAGGAYSFWLFFTTLCLTLVRLETPLAFALATVAALALQALRLGRRRGRRPPRALPPTVAGG